jgi:glutaredoxin
MLTLFTKTGCPYCAMVIQLKKQYFLISKFSWNGVIVAKKGQGGKGCNGALCGKI